MSDAFFPASGMPDSDWWTVLWPDPDRVLADLGLPRGGEVVDLCCGDGLFIAALARLAPRRLYAVDLDRALLERARAALPATLAARVTWVHGDARELPRLLPGPVDRVFLANTFHGIAEPTGFARQVARALRPDGQFVLINWRALPRERTPVLGAPRGPRSALRLSPERLRGLIEPAGFRLVRQVMLPPYHYGAVFAKSGRS